MKIVNDTSLNTEDLDRLLNAARGFSRQQASPGNKIYVVWSQNERRTPRAGGSLSPVNYLLVEPAGRSAANIMKVSPLGRDFSVAEMIAKAGGEEFELPLAYTVDVFSWLRAQFVSSFYYSGWTDFKPVIQDIQSRGLRLHARWPEKSRFHVTSRMARELSEYRRCERTYRSIDEENRASEAYYKKMKVHLERQTRNPKEVLILGEVLEKRSVLRSAWEDYESSLKKAHVQAKSALEAL